MADTTSISFALPDDYIEQTRLLRDKTARELVEVRANIAVLQETELRLVAQLAAMDEIIGSTSKSSDSDHDPVGNNGSSANDPVDHGQILSEPETEESSTYKDRLSVGLLGTPSAPAGSPMLTAGEEGFYHTVQSHSKFEHSSRHSPDLARSVDAVLEVLREHGALHYRTIYDKVEDTGIVVIGKDPAAVLLSRFSRDPRIRRVGSGTYAIAD